MVIAMYLIFKYTYIHQNVHKANKTWTCCEHNKCGLLAMHQLNFTTTTINVALFWSNLELFTIMQKLDYNMSIFH
jgi:hypothetical protein